MGIEQGPSEEDTNFQAPGQEDERIDDPEKARFMAQWEDSGRETEKEFREDAAELMRLAGMTENPRVKFMLKVEANQALRNAERQPDLTREHVESAAEHYDEMNQ